MFRLRTVLATGASAILCAFLATFPTPTAASSISGRIIGGSMATDINLPWMVSIINYGRHVCGGSIINRRTILTAAHCLRFADASLLKVRVGSKNRSSGGKLIAVSSIRYHSQFKSSTMDYDIGVMRLASDLEFSDAVQPVALPAPGEDVADGTDAVVSGWGYYTSFGPMSDYLQYAVVPIINQATCNRLLKNAITDRMLCAGVLQGGVDACQMDSGGPLTIGNKLVGVVSWGYSCALPNKPGVYTRISEVMPWVANYLEQFNEM